jgi:hypothetical protein
MSTTATFNIYFASPSRLTMGPNKLVSLSAALREALASPECLVPVSREEQEARRDIIDVIPVLNAALVGDANVLCELAWPVGKLLL